MRRVCQSTTLKADRIRIDEKQVFGLKQAAVSLIHKVTSVDHMHFKGIMLYYSCKLQILTQHTIT
jgi:hypothetical protein